MKTLIYFLIVLVCFFYSENNYSQEKKRPARILKNSGAVKIEKLDVLNSKEREINVCISPDGKYIYFESERPSSWSTKNYGVVGRYDPDLWYSKKVDGVWQEPVNLGRVINTPNAEGEPNISPDGQTLYYQSWRNDWDKTDGPYYQAQLRGDKWVDPIGMNSGITEFFKEKTLSKESKTSIGTDGSTFSADGKKFIIAFSMDYYGNMDLYMSEKDDAGKWSKFKVLPVSTSYNERTPFLAADGKTLYFSSNGYDGFGKLDIYKTTLNDDGSYGEVVNIGEPFNTKDDDCGFVLTASGDDVFFIRNGDIYYADLRNTETEIKPLHSIILSGTVRDSITSNFLEANIGIFDKATGEEVGTSRSNVITGEYSIILQGGKNYRLIVKKEGYGDYLWEFTTSKDTKINVSKINILLGPPRKAETKIIAEPIKNEPVIECSSKLHETKLSAGINPFYPLALGIKGEINYYNFGFSLIATYLPKVGKYDDPPVPDNLTNDNYSTLFLSALNYNIPLLNCNFYPYLGIYYGVRTRTWKKPISGVIQNGTYSDYPFGLLIGLKYFILKNLYFDAAVGAGKLAFHDIYTGDILRYEFKYMPMFAICYMFEY